MWYNVIISFCWRLKPQRGLRKLERRFTMKMVLFFLVCVVLLLSFFFFGFNSKKKVYSRRIRRWIVKTSQPGKLVTTSILILEGIGIALTCVFTGTFTKVLNLSLDWAEADINPFYVLMSVMMTTAIFIGVVVYLSRVAYKFGQIRKERIISSGR